MRSAISWTKFSSSDFSTPHELAAALMIKINEIDDVMADILRASLSALRPQLVGAIAGDADRVLVEKSEEAA